MFRCGVVDAKSAGTGTGQKRKHVLARQPGQVEEAVNNVCTGGRRGNINGGHGVRQPGLVVGCEANGKFVMKHTDTWETRTTLSHAHV